MIAPVYGGFGIAVGVLLIAALGVESIRDAIFVAIAVALSAMAVGPVASAALGERFGH